MDRLAAPIASDSTSTDAGGWDPRTVWEQRVREPRRMRRSPRIGAADVTVAPAASGRDPLETGRGRVKRAPGRA